MIAAFPLAPRSPLEGEQALARRGRERPEQRLQIVTDTPSPNSTNSTTSFTTTSTNIALTPTSAANRIKLAATAVMQNPAAGAAQAQWSRGSTNNTNMIGSLASLYGGGSIALNGGVFIGAFDAPNTGSSQTYTVQLKSTSSGNNAVWGASLPAYVEAQEIMG